MHQLKVALPRASPTESHGWDIRFHLGIQRTLISILRSSLSCMCAIELVLSTADETPP